MLDDSPYTKQVHVPTYQELLALSTEMDKILNLPVTQSESVSVKGNTLTAYIGDVRSFSEIADMYAKVKLLNSAAEHIVCAYRVAGNRVFESEDYVDDGDPWNREDHSELDDLQQYLLTSNLCCSKGKRQVGLREV